VALGEPGPRFDGWRMVGVAFFVDFVAVGFFFYSYGVFFKAIAAEFGDSRLGVALVALTFAFGRRLLGPRSGLLGALLLLTSFEFAWLARRVQLDVLLALLETLALVAFWRIDRGIGSRRGVTTS